MTNRSFDLLIPSSSWVAKIAEMCFTRVSLRMDETVKNQPQVHAQPAAQKSTAGSLMHDFNASDAQAMSVPKVILSLLIVLLLGLGTGMVFAKMTKPSATSGKSPLGTMISSSSVEKGKTYGSTDTETFKDSAEGKMAEGGVEGEGQFHLVRPGGDSQNVYLTSSNVDLSQFVGHSVKVWGQTQAAHKVGWLMDVGGVKVLE